MSKLFNIITDWIEKLYYAEGGWLKGNKHFNIISKNLYPRKIEIINVSMIKILLIMYSPLNIVKIKSPIFNMTNPYID